MKRNIFLFSVTALTMLLLSSCSNEVDSHVDGNTLLQTDTICRTTFTCETTPTTRAKLMWHSGTANNGAAVHWEVGDQIWVYESYGNRIASTGSNITATQADAKFYFPWLFRADSYKVNYLGHPSNTDGKGLTIRGQVWQGVADQTDHLKYYGDCAVGTATKVTNKTGQYTVRFTHLPAFLNILPYSTNALIRGGMVLKKVVIKSSNVLTGVFPDVGSYGLDLGHATNTGKQIEIFLNNGNGFAVDNDQVNQWRNGIYCVMVPGWHDLTIEYYCTSPITSMPLKFIKIIGAQNYAANTITNITADLSVMSFDYKYYMWDAQEDLFFQQAVSYGQHLTYPVPWPNSFSDSRYYNGPRVATAVKSAQSAPNVNQALWYAQSSPYIDKDIVWMHDGVIHQGGIWLRKLSVIAAERGVNTAERAPNGVDYRDPINALGAGAFNTDWHWNPPYGRPADIQNYIFLPAMGGYGFDAGIGRLGGYSGYWTSNYYVWGRTHIYSDCAYALTFKIGAGGLGLNNLWVSIPRVKHAAFPVFNAQ